MKLLKNKLDEMQEQKLRKSESLGFWIALTGLGAVTGFQFGLRLDFSYIAGELFLTAVLLVYSFCAYYVNGIWDRYLAPSTKTNVICSLFMGGCAAVICWLAISDLGWSKSEVTQGVILASVATFVFFFLLSSFSLMLYKRRRKKLDEE